MIVFCLYEDHISLFFVTGFCLEAEDISELPSSLLAAETSFCSFKTQSSFLQHQLIFIHSISCFKFSRYIAMITKQKAFNKSLVDKDIQIIFLDEAYPTLHSVGSR